MQIGVNVGWPHWLHCYSLQLWIFFLAFLRGWKGGKIYWVSTHNSLNESSIITLTCFLKRVHGCNFSCNIRILGSLWSQLWPHQLHLLTMPKFCSRSRSQFKTLLSHKKWKIVKNNIIISWKKEKSLTNALVWWKLIKI